MKWMFWRRSENVEDYTDPQKPVEPVDLTEFNMSINEMIKITNSDQAKELGADDIIENK